MHTPRYFQSKLYEMTNATQVHNPPTRADKLANTLQSTVCTEAEVQQLMLGVLQQVGLSTVDGLEGGTHAHSS